MLIVSIRAKFSVLIALGLFLALATVPTSSIAQTQVSTVTKSCQDGILSAGSSFVSSRVNAISKCINAAVGCKAAPNSSEQTACLAKLIIPGKGDCARDKLDSGSSTLGQDAAARVLAGASGRLDQSLSTFVKALQSSCFGSPVADLSSITGGLGFPDGLTEAAKLADELNRTPDGLGCLSLNQLIESAPRTQEIVDELRALSGRCVSVKSANSALFLAPCTSNSSCGAGGVCGEIAFALSTNNIACNTPCEIGKVFQGGVCVPCEAGSIADGTNQTVCSLCLPGSFSHVSGLSACIPCLKGTATAQQGATQCEPCTAGRYAPITGASSCPSCSPGTFTNASGQTACQSCPAGKFTSALGSTTCFNCSVGHYSAAASSSACSACSPGTFAQSSGQSQCDSCPAGRFSSAAAASTCFNCPAGRFASETGSTSCDQCPSGSFAASDGQVACTNCPAGRYSSTPGSTACALCERGYFSNVNAATSCQSCPAGKFASQTGQTFCQSCGVGQYSLPAAAACTDCPDGSIAPVTSSAQCVACPEHAVSNTGHTECLCEVNYLATTPVDGVFQCELCPEGANCTAVGTTWENVQALPGWYRIGNTFYRCLIASQCPGGGS